MTKQERAITIAFVEGIKETLANSGAVANPLLEFRLKDILISQLLARRLEQELIRKEYGGEFNGGFQEKQEPQEEDNAKDAKTHAPANAPKKETPKRPSLITLIEAIGKARERARKAIKELEEHCAKRETPINIGLADYMKPLIEKAGGILDELDTGQEQAPPPDSATTPG